MDNPPAHLFKPLTLRHKTLKNRFIFGAHTADLTVKKPSLPQAMQSSLTTSQSFLDKP
jgi:2,4-dienoyl-CoA reductase-like NADH-dependent reductase (Old Yellow Enzyme family)